MIAPVFAPRANAVPSSGKMEKNVFNYFLEIVIYLLLFLRGDNTGSRDDFILINCLLTGDKIFFMKRMILICGILLTCIDVKAQTNLVLNGGFEHHTTCPDDFDEVFYCTNWQAIDSGVPSTYDITYDCEADYMNSCGVLPLVHSPHSGNGFMALTLFNDGSIGGADSDQEYDYLQGHLASDLVSGKSYCVRLYVGMTWISHYAIGGIGIYFDDGSIDTASECNKPQTEYTPQILDTAVIDDTNWVLIQGTFTAHGGERLLTIGNFSDFAHTEHVWLWGSGESYYAIDDVSVIASDDSVRGGPDVYVATGDTAWIGTGSVDDALPCYWYKLGDMERPIDSGGLVPVRPDTTTTYVVMMDLCGNVTYDTVVVFDTGCAPASAIEASFTAKASDTVITSYNGVDTVYFTYTGAGPFDSLVWNFGDSTRGYGYSPVHTYLDTVADSFNVTVTLYGPCGNRTARGWIYTRGCPGGSPAFFTYSIFSFVAGSSADVDFSLPAGVMLDSVAINYGDGSGWGYYSSAHTYDLSRADSFFACEAVQTACGSDTFCRLVYGNPLIASPPVFAAGDTQLLSLCAGQSRPLSSLLKAYDLTTGQRVVWSPVVMPTHGTLHATDTLYSGDDLLTPTGMRYVSERDHPGSDTFSVSVSDSLRGDTAIFYVTIYPLPSAGTLSGPASICAGDSATFVDTSGTGYASGTWSLTNTAVATLYGTGSVVGNTSGTDTVRFIAMSNEDCNDTAWLPVNVIAVDAGTISGKDSVCEGETDTLYESTTGGIWATNAYGLITPLGVSASLAGITPGLDTVSYSVSASGCAGVAMYTVKVLSKGRCDTLLRVAEVSNATDFNVFPNPAGQTLTIEATGTLSIYNAIGQQMYAGFVAKTRTIDVSKLPQGVYLVRVTNDGLSEVKRVVIER
jgi:Secretion system C-terminal sorting domain